jgi:nucleotide-binding universal stress UspA family protein
MAFQKILCPVDFSETSRHALDRAADLARSDGASLTLLHVLSGGAIAGGTTRPGATVGLSPLRLSPVVVEAGAEHAERTLADWCATLVKQGVPRAEQVIAHGDPAAEILQRAQEGDHDLIVLGTHGKTGVLGALLGNVSYKVVRTATCSVLTVRVPGEAQ